MTKRNISQRLFGGFPGARYIGEEEASLALSVLKARSPYRYYGLKPLECCTRLERRLGAMAGKRKALCVSSGTAALHAALFAAGIKPGDEVILPAYAWSADLLAILAVGATPVIAPIDETLGLDARAIALCCTKKTKAAIAVHMRGMPCNVKALRRETKRLKLALIEDCAQCLGGTVAGKPVGSFGDIAIFSFQYNKLITSGEGGALVTDNQGFFDRAKCFHDLGMMRDLGSADPSGALAIQCFGLNYRMSELQAAVLLAQLQKLPAILGDLRLAFREAGRVLERERNDHKLAPRKRPPGAKPNGAFYCLQAPPGQSAEDAVNALRKNDFPAQWCGTHDPHHYASWISFLDREKLPYRLLRPEQSDAFLCRSLFLELNPQALQGS